MRNLIGIFFLFIGCTESTGDILLRRPSDLSSAAIDMTVMDSATLDDLTGVCIIGSLGPGFCWNSAIWESILLKQCYRLGAPTVSRYTLQESCGLDTYQVAVYACCP